MLSPHLQRTPLIALFLVLIPTLTGCVSSEQSKNYDALSNELAELPHINTSLQTSDPFKTTKTLDRQSLIREVLNSNPSIEAARVAWQQALAKYPQARSFSDPIVSYEFGPATIGTERFGQTVKVAQRFEWPGKQAFRAAVALAEAQAKRETLASVKLNLQTMASLLFDDYYVVQHALTINQEHLNIVKRLRQSAEAHYDSGHGSQQDPLQVDVERGLLEKDRLALQARKEIIVSQINGLLHRDPASPLPPAPTDLKPAVIPQLDEQHWVQQAEQHQPDLQTIRYKMDAGQNAIKSANRSFYPDFTIMGSYSSMWPKLPHRFMIGFSINIPINLDSRNAKVDEANAMLDMAKVNYIQKLNDISVNVRKALLQYKTALDQLALYKQKIIPAAQRRIDAAEAGYITGKIPFSDMLIAQRQLKTFQREYFETIANTWRSRAALIQNVGTAQEILPEQDAATDDSSSQKTQKIQQDKDSLDHKGALK